MAVIETRGLTRDFGEGKGIIDLDLRVGKGVVHGLGPAHLGLAFSPPWTPGARC